MSVCLCLPIFACHLSPCLSIFVSDIHVSLSVCPHLSLSIFVHVCPSLWSITCEGVLLGMVGCLSVVCVSSVCPCPLLSIFVPCPSMWHCLSVLQPCLFVHVCLSWWTVVVVALSASCWCWGRQWGQGQGQGQGPNLNGNRRGQGGGQGREDKGQAMIPWQIDLVHDSQIQPQGAVRAQIWREGLEWTCFSSDMFTLPFLSEGGTNKVNSMDTGTSVGLKGRNHRMLGG